MIPSAEPQSTPLTQLQRIQLLAGLDAWHLRPLPEAGIPSLEVADCGHGVTVCTDHPKPATCLPTGIGLASTWNVDLIEEAGKLLGTECRALGISMLLGPKINLHRIPLNGRSFETFSEDPVLAGKLGAALIRGIQSTGVGACLKALAANNQQHDQQKTNVVVEERVLRELYLLNFEIATREGNPLALMTSYNPLHEINCAENKWLIRKVIKTEWGFPGIVMSDWRAVTTPAVYRSGLDLEMPGPGNFLNPEALEEAIAENLLSEEDLRDRSDRMFRVLSQLTETSATVPDPTAELDGDQHRKIARKVAKESIVLLKNQNNFLPLKKEQSKRIAVIGPNAAEARLGGGGSASVTPSHSVSVLEGVRKEFGDDCEVLFSEGCGLVGEMEPIPIYSGEAEYYNHGEIKGEPVDAWPVNQIDYSWGWASPGGNVKRGEYAARFTGKIIAPESGTYRVALHGQEGGIRLRIGSKWVIDKWVSLDTQDFEGAYGTRSEIVEVDLQKNEAVEVEVHYGKRAARGALRLEWESLGSQGPMAKALRLAAKVDVVVLCLGLSNVFEGGGADRKNLDLPEVQLQLLKSIVSVNPKIVVVLNNGGPLVMPWEESVPAILEAWYPGQEGGDAVAAILSGKINPSGKTPDTIPYRLEDHASHENYPGEGGQVTYKEGLMIGYRHFDHAEIKPHFPFGFGLSYTTFEMGALQVSGDPKTSVIVTVTVTNTGEVAGAEVIQVYVHDVEASVLRPPQELKTFAKVFLEPGERRELQFILTPRDFSFWDTQTKDWKLEDGAFELRVGTHSRSYQSITITA